VAPIIFPNVIQVLIDYMLTTEPQTLLNCPVASQVPNRRPTRFVNLYSVPGNGPQRLTLSTRRVVAQIYETSEFLTGTLAETVRGVIVDAQYQHLGIKEVRIIGEPAKFPAPAIPNRWQLTADITARAIPSLL
jgi:hypothetical protein